ncbi:MAG: hypothetical protein VX307_02865, partial [Chloroflexota bacterium]|nr:hypothetical protein [Chloroflexota bacterium]
FRLGNDLATDMDLRGVEVGGGLMAARGLGVCSDVTGEAVVPCVTVTDGWACSGDGGLWLVLSAAGDSMVGIGEAVGWTTLVDVVGVTGPPQAATARAKTTAAASAIRFNTGLRYVESIVQPAAASAGNMTSLNAASSRWG